MTIPDIDAVRAANEQAKRGVMIYVVYDGTEYFAALSRCDELLAEVERLRAALSREYYGYATSAETAAVLGVEPQ